MKQIFVNLLLLIITICSSGQELTIGETLPETRFTEVVNYSKPVIEPEDTKSKIVLYDFWATWCGSCVANMPKMAALQREFGDELKVVLVTTQKKEEVERFYTKRPEFKALGLPIVTNDSIMYERFPYRMVPQVVWVGKDRVVKAITYAESVTTANITTLKTSNTIVLPLKHDIVDFDFYQPFRKSDLATSTVLQQSTLARSIPGVGSGMGFHKLDSMKTRMYVSNTDLVGLVWYSFLFELEVPHRDQRTRLIIETKKKDLFTFYENHEQQLAQSYCYEAILYAKDGMNTRRILAAKLQRDIEDAFGWKIGIERKLTDCYVLKTEKAETEVASKNMVDKKPDKIVVENVSLNKLAGALADVYKFDLPLMYEGGNAAQYRFELAKHYADFDTLKAVLKRNGFLLEKEKRNLDMIVVRDKEASQ